MDNKKQVLLACRNKFNPKNLICSFSIDKSLEFYVNFQCNFWVEHTFSTYCISLACILKGSVFCLLG